MYFSIFLAILIYQSFIQLSTTSGILSIYDKEICNFNETVNLTNQHSYENGSYEYQGILIPLKKQRFYNYDIKFLKKNISVAIHRRGCVCDNKPCIKLCCDPTEYFYESKNVSQCEKLTSEMKVNWNLTITLQEDVTKEVDLFEHFTPQVGLPCQYPEYADPLLDEWSLTKDGNLIMISDDNAELDTLNYCYSLFLNETDGNHVLLPFTCPLKNVNTWKELLNSWSMAISVLFLIPTILVYLVLKELRGNMRGKLLICYLLSLTVGYSIISFINLSGMIFDYVICSTLGYTCYFFFMAAFLWLSVLCFDIWKNFRETNVELNSKRQQQWEFIVYSLYAWTTAGLATGILYFIQKSPNIDKSFKPDIGIEICWLNTSKWSAAIYFYGPSFIIVLFNMATFIHLTERIYRVRSDITRMTQREKFIRENAVVILRLFLIMGVSWVFDTLSYCLRKYTEWEFLFVLSDFANAIQGVLIFSLFVLKPKVLNRLKSIFQRRPIERPRKSISTSTTNFSKLHSISSSLPVPHSS